MDELTTLDLADLRRANIGRQTDWHGSADWCLGQWSNALCGEVGEVANLIKKFERGDFDQLSGGGVIRPLSSVAEPLADELADVLIYLDLLAMRAGIDLADAVRSKFNRKSRQIGSDVLLGGVIADGLDLVDGARPAPTDQRARREQGGE